MIGKALKNKEDNEFPFHLLKLQILGTMIIIMSFPYFLWITCA